MKKLFSLIFLWALSSPLLFAQNIVGSWNGVLDVMGTKLHLVFHFKEADSVLSGKMDSPDQHAYDIPVSKIEWNNSELYLEVMGGAIKYEAKLKNDLLEGTFKQSGMDFPLNLKPGLYETKEVVRPQEPKAPFPYKIEEVSFANEQADGIKLAGTLTLPKKGKNFPTAILISGSGPQDRDETLFEHKPFLVIADYLTKNGIAVLRFDDRGTAQSEGDFASATTADFATDVEAAVAYLRTRKEINSAKIGLIGHSEGGIIAPMVAAKDKDIRFIVLLAGPGVDGKEILIMQTEAMSRAAGMPENDLMDARKANQQIYDIIIQETEDSIMEQRMIDSLEPYMLKTLSRGDFKNFVENTVAGTNTPWMKYFLVNNPQQYLKQISCPVLALSGTKDLQVPAEINIKAIEKALKEGGNKKVTTKIYPGLNHLFQHAETGMVDEYGKIEETFAPEVLKEMMQWIKKN